MARANFDPQQLRNRLADFDEIRTSELTPEDQTCSHHSQFLFDPTTWVVSANTKHD